MIENAALHINGIEFCQKLNGVISFPPTLKENDVRRCTMLKLSEECQPPILVLFSLLFFWFDLFLISWLFNLSQTWIFLYQVIT